MINIETATQEWQDAALENFSEALVNENMAFCKAIIVDTLEAGHYKLARAMNEMLRAAYKPNQIMK